MPKPTITQLRALLAQFGHDDMTHKERAIHVAGLLREQGFEVTNHALVMMARGKTSCPPGIYSQLLNLTR